MCARRAPSAQTGHNWGHRLPAPGFQGSPPHRCLQRSPGILLSPQAHAQCCRLPSRGQSRLSDYQGEGRQGSSFEARSQPQPTKTRHTAQTRQRPTAYFSYSYSVGLSIDFTRTTARESARQGCCRWSPAATAMRQPASHGRPRSLGDRPQGVGTQSACARIRMIGSPTPCTLDIFGLGGMVFEKPVNQQRPNIKRDEKQPLRTAPLCTKIEPTGEQQLAKRNHPQHLAGRVSPCIVGDFGANEARRSKGYGIGENGDISTT